MNKVQELFPGMTVEYTNAKPEVKIKKGKKFKAAAVTTDAISETESVKTEENKQEVGLAQNSEDAFNQYVTLNFEKEMGFSLVIEEMIKAKKPLVGHNFIYDVAFLYDQFVAPMPDTFSEFSQKWRECFPDAYDTKTIALKSDLKLFRKTDLESLYKTCRTDSTLLKEINYCIDPNPLFERYHNQEDFFKEKSGSSCLHEAGFDSFMTGVIFLCMTKHIQTLQSQKKNTPAAKSTKKSKSKKAEETKFDQAEENSKCAEEGIKVDTKNKEEVQLEEKVTEEKVTEEKELSTLDFGVHEQVKHLILRNVKGRYWNFRHDFDGQELDMDMTNVIWVKWGNPSTGEVNYINDEESKGLEKPITSENM
jgi:hypothetical protein